MSHFRVACVECREREKRHARRLCASRKARLESLFLVPYAFFASLFHSPHPSLAFFLQYYITIMRTRVCTRSGASAQATPPLASPSARAPMPARARLAVCALGVYLLCHVSGDSAFLLSEPQDFDEVRGRDAHTPHR